MPKFEVRVEYENGARRTVTYDADSEEQARRRGADSGGRVVWAREIDDPADDNDGGEWVEVK